MMLLDRFHDLPDGPRVRLRLARSSDRPALEGLFADAGLAVDELDVRRALRFEPGRRHVIVATTWREFHEEVLGLGVIEDGRATIIGAPCCHDLMEHALEQHARTWRRRVA